MNPLANMKIGTRLALGSGAAVLLMLGMTGSSIWAQKTLDGINEEALHAERRAWLLTQIDRDSAKINTEIASMLVEPDSAQGESHQEAIHAIREHLQQAMGRLKTEGNTVEQQAQLATIDEAIADLHETNQQVVKLLQRAERAGGQSLFGATSRPKLATLAKLVATLDGEYVKSADASNERAESFQRTTGWFLIGIGAAAMVLTVLFGRSAGRSAVAPIGRTVSILSELASGDLTRSMPDDLLARKDEIGMLAQAVQALGENLRATVSDVSSSATALSMAATEMSKTAQRQSSGSKDVATLAKTVASAAEESSANTSSVAAAMEQTSNNLSSVATATEEMSATVGEIASNAEKARSISSEATQQAQTISTMMNELGRAARDIGKVTEAITGISAQTNLLALNATIEAARAGAAGKGFAVVANEIKELAHQTSAATEDIKSKISGIQASTGSSIDNIEKIARVIGDVGEIVSSIAAAIEEQSTVTRDVANNIAQATSGVRDASERIANTASASQSIAKDIAAVTSTVTELVTGSETLHGSSSDLHDLAEILSDRVGKFKV